VRRAKLAEYHLWAWRKDLSIQAGLANAEIRTGAAASQRGSPEPSLLSLRCKFDCWDSASKLMPLPRSYGAGASATEIGATFRSGCLTCGKSRWIQTPAREPRPWAALPARKSPAFAVMMPGPTTARNTRVRLFQRFRSLMRAFRRHSAEFECPTHCLPRNGRNQKRHQNKQILPRTKPKRGALNQAWSAAFRTWLSERPILVEEPLSFGVPVQKRVSKSGVTFSLYLGFPLLPTVLQWSSGNRRKCTDGKRPITCAMMGFLARWARRLSWRETAQVFQTSWEAV
jgi:hypothetical protein